MTAAQTTGWVIRNINSVYNFNHHLLIEVPQYDIWREAQNIHEEGGLYILNF